MTRLVEFFRTRFHDITPPVKLGYAVWSGVGLTIAIPEIWAAFGDPRWPTISGTVGYLETLWDGSAVIVVAVIVVIAGNAVRFYGAAMVAARVEQVLSSELGAATAAPAVTEPHANSPDAVAAAARVEQADGLVLGVTAGGWVTSAPHREPTRERELSALLYFPIALGLVVTGCVLASTLTDDEWVLGYVIYGLIGVMFLIVPSLLGYFGRTPNAPFASLLATILDLQGRLHFVTLVLLAGLVVLLIHLALYPWPDIFRPEPSPNSP
jgi:hypothetical protein